jgi:hypothetical protein
MTYHMWRLSEAAPDNLGLACTDEGLLLGGTSLIEQREGRFVVRDRDEIERLLRCGHRYIGEADRLMPGLAAVARALNAGDQCLAHIAAVHLKLPDLPNRAAREAMEAEDSLIKYARGGGSIDWNPALHPRTGMPPNAGWFAPAGGNGTESRDDESGRPESRLRLTENQDDTHRTDAPSGVHGEPVPRAHNVGEPGELSSSATDRSSTGHNAVQGGINAAVPGAFYATRAQEQFGEGNYGAAVIYGAASLVDAAIGVLTLGESTQLGVAIRTTEHVAEGVSVAARTAELNLAIPAAQRGRITMAVGSAVDANGVQQVLIGTSEPMGYLRPGVTLNPGEILVSGSGHAEADIVHFARQNGLNLIQIGATRPICPACASLIKEAGPKPVTPLKVP